MMTSQSPRIYLYKITFEEIPYYYYGVHKEKKFNEYYWGSPYTHKWCWNFYTPKKQILQFFDFTDEGWIKAQEVETRLIKPFYNTDKWCLNESCGGRISLQIRRKTGRKSGLKNKQNKVGIHGRTKDKIIKDSSKGGKTNVINNTGVCGRSKEKMSEDGKKGGNIAKDLKLGICGLDKEERVKNAKQFYKNGTGFAILTKKERSEIAKKTNAQKWECTETGYIANPGNLSKYQKRNGIDTSKRIRIE